MYNSWQSKETNQDPLATATKSRSRRLKVDPTDIETNDVSTQVFYHLKHQTKDHGNALTLDRGRKACIRPKGAFMQIVYTKSYSIEVFSPA